MAQKRGEHLRRHILLEAKQVFPRAVVARHVAG
jgi:hypothetical protein